MTKLALLVVVLLVVASPVRAQTPTPMRPAPKAAYDSNAPKPVMIFPRAANWQRFQGATRCEQVGRTLTCDNGYRQTFAR